MRRLALLAVLLLPACARGPRAARMGDRVTVHYSAVVDGKLFETSEDAHPVELVLGEGGLPAPVERALVGLKPGEQAALDVPEAYGPVDPKKIEELPLSSFGDMAPKLAPGLRVLGVRGDQPAQATVLSVGGGRARLDFNHRLAGKTVSFRVRLLAVRSGTPPR